MLWRVPRGQLCWGRGECEIADWGCDRILVATICLLLPITNPRCLRDGADMPDGCFWVYMWSHVLSSKEEDCPVVGPEKKKPAGRVSSAALMHVSVWRSSYVEGAEKVAGPTLSIKAFFGSERVFFGSERQFLDSSE